MLLSSIQDASPVPVDEQRAAAYALVSRSLATRRAYASDWSLFIEWCAEKGYPSLPVDPRHLAGYVAERAATHRPSTLSRKLAAISVAHKTAGFKSPIGEEPVPATMAGIRRTHGVAQRKKTPVRVSNLRSAMPDFPDDLRGKRDRAIVLLGYAGGFRRSELVSLDVEDVTFVPEGAVVDLRKSKTDQEGRGSRKALHYGRSPQTCPVSALLDWISCSGIVAGPLFRGIGRHGNMRAVRLCDKSVSVIVKSRARLLGFDPKALGAHSLRAGLVTDGYAAGVAEADIMRQTGHKSRAVLEGYYREANLFRGNVTERVGL